MAVNSSRTSTYIPEIKQRTKEDAASWCCCEEKIVVEKEKWDRMMDN